MSRLLRLLGLAFVLGWLVYLVSLGGLGRALVAGLFYVLAGYVLFRAWPAIRTDLRSLHRGGRPGLPWRRGGDHL